MEIRIKAEDVEIVYKEQTDSANSSYAFASGTKPECYENTRGAIQQLIDGVEKLLKAR